MSGTLNQKASPKSEIGLRNLVDIDEGNFSRERPDTILHNQLLISYNVEERPKKFVFKYLSDILKAGSGVTFTEVDGVITIDATGGAGSASWGNILTGTGVASQTDLITYLDANYYPLSSNPLSYLIQADTDSLYVPLTRTLTINGVSYDLSADRSWSISGTGVTNVSATAPLTSSGGTTPDISTSMTTNKLIGRGTAGTGVMEEITIGTGLYLSATTLNVGNIDLSVLAVTETAARLDNWTPTGWPGTTADVVKVIQLNANYVDKVQIISGLTNGTAGKIITLSNVSTDNLVIIELGSTNSLAANRFRGFGRDAYFLFPGCDVTFLYNGNLWSQFSGNMKNGHTLFDDMGGPNHVGTGIFTSYFGETGYGLAAGSGALVRNETNMTNSIGTIGLTTGTQVSSSTGFAKIVMNGRGGTGFNTSSTQYNQFAVVTRLRLEALPTALQDFRFQTGLVSNSNSLSPSIVGMLGWYCSSANANWKCYAANTSSTIVSDTVSGLPVTLNADIVLITYHPNPLGDTVFVYSSDGGVTYTVDSRFVRVTSNYGGAPVIAILKTVGTTSVTADIDYIGLTIKGTRT